MLHLGGDGLKRQQLIGMLQAAATPAMVISNDYVRFGARSSRRLHACLDEVISSGRTAHVNVDHRRPLGNFGRWQDLNVTDALLVEAGVRGMGVAIAIHEIWENFCAWSSPDGFGKYGPAHAAALEVEGAVAAELRGEEGSRVARVEVGADDSLGYVLDYQRYFLLLEPRPHDQWDTGRFTARTAEREEVESFDVDGVTPGVRVAGDKVAEIVAKLREHPRATAEVYGMLADDRDRDAAKDRAAAVRNAIIVALGEDSYATVEEEQEQEGILLSEVQAKGAGTDLGARRAWTSTAPGIDAMTTVRVEVWEPA